VNYIAQIAEAVDYIHQRNILHRDIKPDNIIITPENKAVLIDFGSAREFVPDKTKSHTAILTAGYAPLEQYSSEGRRGSYTDIYALGATFYFALTGQKPMDAATRTIETMPEPKELVPSIPAEANHTIIKAMQLKPANRQQRVEEFMDDLLMLNQNQSPRPPVPPLKQLAKGKEKKSLSKEKKSLSIIIVILIVTFIVSWQIVEAFVRYEEKSAKTTYNEHISNGDALAAQGEDSYKQSMAEYEAAIKINERKKLGITSAINKKEALSQQIDIIVEDFKDRADQFIELLGAEGGRNDAIALLEKAQKLKHDNLVEYRLKQLKQ
jgi:serine/threonine protein kinase